MKGSFFMNYSLEICNKALSHCKTKGIASLEERSFEAEVLNKWYESSLLTTLSAINWNFATKFSKLALTDVEIPGWSDVYQIPKDLVKLLKVTTTLEEEYKDGDSFVIIGKYICSNLSGARALYITNDLEPDSFTPEFSLSFSLCLASNIVGELSGSSQFAQSLGEQYRLSLFGARSSNFKQESRKPEKINKYAQARKW